MNYMANDKLLFLWQAEMRLAWTIIPNIALQLTASLCLVAVERLRYAAYPRSVN